MEKEDLVPTNPFAPRGQLGAELRRLRESAGLYLDEVANHLDCSVAKLSRLETGTGSPKLRDIRDLLDFYQVEDPKVRDRFFGWVEDGRDTKWVRSYGNWMTNFGKYLPLEAAATSIKLNQSWICPGLLQTPGYARAIIADCYPERSPDEITEFTRLRMQRQELWLNSENPAQVTAVIDECVLHRPLGSPDMRREQFYHLIELGESPFCDIRIHPFSAGIHRGSSHPFIIFEGPSGERSISFETPHDIKIVKNKTEVESYCEAFDLTLAHSLSKSESLDLIRRFADSLDS